MVRDALRAPHHEERVRHYAGSSLPDCGATDLAGVSSSGRSSTSSNSTMLSISVPIAMLVTRSRMNSTTTGTLNSAIHFPRGGERRLRVVRIGNADRLAAEPLGDRDV